MWGGGHLDQIVRKISRPISVVGGAGYGGDQPICLELSRFHGRLISVVEGLRCGSLEFLSDVRETICSDYLYYVRHFASRTTDYKHVIITDFDENTIRSQLRKARIDATVIACPMCFPPTRC